MKRTDKKGSNGKATSQSNTYTLEIPGYQSFSDILAIIQDRFNIEKNEKNRAYHFILSRGLYDDYAEFCRTQSSDDPHGDILSMLSTNSGINQKKE